MADYFNAPQKEPQALYATRLGFYTVASTKGFWSGGVGVSGDKRCRPAGLATHRSSVSAQMQERARGQ